MSAKFQCPYCDKKPFPTQRKLDAHQRQSTLCMEKLMREERGDFTVKDDLVDSTFSGPSTYKSPERKRQRKKVSTPQKEPIVDEDEDMDANMGDCLLHLSDEENQALYGMGIYHIHISLLKI